MLEFSYNDDNFFLSKIDNDKIVILLSGNIKDDNIKINKNITINGDLKISKNKKIISNEKTELSNLKDIDSKYGEVVGYDNEKYTSILPLDELELNSENILSRYKQYKNEIILLNNYIDIISLNSLNEIKWNFKTPNNLNRNFFKVKIFTVNNDNFDKKYNINYKCQLLSSKKIENFKNVEIFEKSNSISEHEFILSFDKEWTNNIYYSLTLKINNDDVICNILSINLIYNTNYFNGKI